MAVDHIDRRDYGKLEAKVEQLTTDVHSLKKTIEEMRDMMQQAKGGWRVIMLVAGVAGTIGALLGKAVSRISIS